ncbi:MAG: SDR family oxidoreductase [Flavobacteriaceae bacterium]|nr:SDR family oxidoreductase [Flavobacteriaceae bacterium]
MDFNNKVIWITGASSGIGKGLAMALAKLNTQLILSSRNETSLMLVKEACENKENIAVLPLDLALLDQMPLKASEALKFFGRVDVVIHNGGVSQRALVKDTLVSVDERLMRVNYLGTVALTKAILPHFTTHKKGHFIVVTSVVGTVATPLRSSYAASKHALHGFFDSLRAEIYQENIQVTLVCPGFVKTQVSMNSLTGDGSPQKKMDTATENGLSVERFVSCFLRKMKHNPAEIVIGGFKEKLVVYLKRFFPTIVRRVMRKIKVV